MVVILHTFKYNFFLTAFSTSGICRSIFHLTETDVNLIKNLRYFAGEIPKIHLPPGIYPLVLRIHYLSTVLLSHHILQNTRIIEAQ